MVIDRDAAARLGVNTIAIDNALNNAYSQRQVSTIYTQRNQYKVVLEIDPRLQTDPSLLDRIYVGAAGGKQVPLSAVAHFERGTAPLAVRHQGQFPAATISFNLAPGMALGDAETAVQSATRELRMPEDVRTEFAGNARFLQQSLSTQPLLIAAALISIYIVLGVLYESLLHPLTIISTLPSAGIGALLALLITGNDLSIMGLIGIILLMGIVKKNAIMLVDFALEAERQRGLSPCAGDPRGMPRTVPADHDDDAGGAARRGAAGAGIRHRRGTAPAARHLDHRRPDRLAGADALHDAGGVSGAGAAGREATADRGAG